MGNIAQKIKEFNQDRLQDKIQLKYALMAQDAFRFFRGSCHLFYEDLAAAPPLPPGPAVWICGDLHLENFGSFKGADRQVYFDINDFDESLLAPASWELARLLSSLALAGKTATYSPSRIKHLVRACCDGYIARLQKGKPMTIETATATGLIKILLEKVEFRKEKKLLKERADKKTSYSRFLVDEEKAFALPYKQKRALLVQVNSWLQQTRGTRKWTALDAVFRIAGTGSIGIRRYGVLVKNNLSGKKVILDIKQSLPSSLSPYLTLTQPSFETEADRILSIQYRMQHVCPDWIGKFHTPDGWFILKEIQPTADRLDFISFKDQPVNQDKLVFTLGELAASAQLRSAGRQGAENADALIQFGGQEQWAPAIVDYALAYASKAQRDYREFCNAFNKGYFR